MSKCVESRVEGIQLVSGDSTASWFVEDNPISKVNGNCYCLGHALTY